MHGVAEASVGRLACMGVPEVVECAQNVVMVAWREGELQELRIRNLAGGAPPEEATLEQVFLAAPSGRRDLGRGPDGTLVREETLQHADRGVERGARAVGRFAVPTSVLQLLAEETAGQTLR